MNRERKSDSSHGKFHVAVALFALAFTAGCASTEDAGLTGRVWDHDNFKKFSLPDPHSDIAIFDTADHRDILVQYNAWSERKGKTTRLAYFLEANAVEIANGDKPNFVPLAAADTLSPIPILPAAALATNAPMTRTFAVTNNSRCFTLYRTGTAERKYELPVYVESRGVAARLALTPFALAGDVLFSMHP
jgi:hypothetical protein